MLKNPALLLSALLCLAGCMGAKPKPPAEASSAPSARFEMPTASVLDTAERMLFAEVDEFVGLGHEALKDSLWFQAAEDFDSALARLSTLSAHDSLSPGVGAHIAAYRDSVQKLMVSAVAMTTQATSPAPWTQQFDQKMEEVSDSTVHVMDSLTHHAIDPRNYDLPLTSPLNERILQAMAVFTGPGRGYFTKWLSRKSKYEALVIPRLEARDMPKDLIYLAMVESGFNPKAWSKAAAAGMWQFISGTGRRYGLKDDWWYDPRRDPVLATEAALDYLEDLYGEFGDWHQAMAAYNCGEGRVRRFRNANPAMSYWDMPLPQETRFYVPKILAAMIIGHNPERYGFKIDNPEPPLAFDTATVVHCLSIATIAKASGAREDDIIALNPALRRWCTPPNRPSHVVYLPPGSREGFVKAYTEMDKSKLVNWHHHIVGRGETLGGIASRYRVSTAAIKATNKMKGSRLRPGQSLLIPIAPEDAGRWAERDPEEAQAKSSKYAGGTYKVRPGDNLFDIARKFNTSVSRLLAANGLRAGAIIRPGQRLKLSGGKGKGKGRPGTPISEEKDYRTEPPLPDAIAARPEAPSRAAAVAARGDGSGEEDAEEAARAPEPRGKPRVHVVAAGDNLYNIARQHGVSQDDLMRWNRLKGTGIMAGQRLKYYSEGAAPGGEEAPARSRLAKGLVSTPTPLSGSAGAKRWHKVQSGENLYQIARQHGLDHHSLMALNDLGADDKIFPGDSLIVSGAGRPDAAPRAQERAADRDEGAQYYLVRPGDTLWDIASRHRTTVQKLKELNGRLASGLKAGTRIRVR